MKMGFVRSALGFSFALTTLTPFAVAETNLPPLTDAIQPRAVLAAMERVADWQLANPSKHKPTDWTEGACYAGMMALANASKNPKYLGAMMRMEIGRASCR